MHEDVYKMMGDAAAAGKKPPKMKKKRRKAAKMCSTGLIPSALTDADQANQAYMIERSRFQVGE